MFQQTVVTETSASMVMRLKRARKYTAVVGSGDVTQVVGEATRQVGGP
jgi:hypothetical protein